MNINRFISQVLFSSFCYLVCWAAIAEPIADIYHVELIIFEHTDPKRYDAEKWPQFVGNLDLKGAVKLNIKREALPYDLAVLDTLDALDEVGSEPVKQVQAESITAINPKHFLLKEEERTIRTSKHEHFVQHVAWNQPLVNNVKSTPVFFTGGGKDHKQAQCLITIKPVRNAFNVSIDLIYQVDASTHELRLTRDVKVRKRETFYIDHPVLGAFIVLAPVIYESDGNKLP